MLRVSRNISKGHYYWHVHHESLIERANYPISERITYIKRYKTRIEVPTRLRLLKKVKNEQAIFDKMNELNELNFVSVPGYPGAYSNKLTKFVKELHAKECKKCPWNGKTIFPRGLDKKA